jgi:pre-mRNA-splicing helicase BRR2
MCIILLSCTTLIQLFDNSRLQAQVQPITRSLLRIDLSIIPDVRWDEKIHGTAETFHIMVEDVDGEIILFHDSFILRQRYAEDEHNVSVTVPMFEPTTTSPLFLTVGCTLKPDYQLL